MSALHVVSTILVLSAAGRGNVGRTVWALVNLLDTLRSLKEVRPNGRRVGVTVRRKLIKQCLVGWIVFVAAQPVGLVADLALFWFPFYRSLKMLLTLVLVVWRLQSSHVLYNNFIAPALHRYEKHIDLTILLVHSAYALVAFFLVYLPWQLGRAFLVAVGILADDSAAASGQAPDVDDNSSDDTPSHSSRSPRSAPKLPLAKHTASPRSSGPSVSERQKPADPKRKAPAKTQLHSQAGSSVSERRAAIERAAIEAAREKDKGKDKDDEDGAPVVTGLRKRGVRQAPLPKPPAIPTPAAAPVSEPAAARPSKSSARRSAGAGPSAAHAPAPTRTRKPALAVKATAEELLLALPRPPSALPTTSVTATATAPATAPADTVPSPSSAPVDPAAQPQVRDAVAVGAGVPPRVSPRKRARGKKGEDAGGGDSDGRAEGEEDRPLKRAASTRRTGAAKPATKIAKPTAATAGPPRLTGVAARARVISDAQKEAAEAAVPKTKRRAAASVPAAATTTAAKKTRTTK